MANGELSQNEADSLLAMPKRIRGSRPLALPAPGQNANVEIESVDGQELFLLDLYRGRVAISKRTHQNRARRVEILARLDLDGPPHTNPDGSQIGRNHLHVYREGYGEKWAIEPPAESFTDFSDWWVTLEEFLKFCNITGTVEGQQEFVS